MALPRLRQVVFAARRLEPLVDELRSVLPLEDAYVDPAVGAFGLRNAVLALGDTFVEVVSPVRDGTAAGRYLDRQGGDTGYMVMAQLDDRAAVRRRLSEQDVRVVWDFDEPDVLDLHLHPRDVPGPLLAVDVMDPPESWRWGGPAWTGTAPQQRTAPQQTAPQHEVGGLRGVTVAVADPHAAAVRWAGVLGVSGGGTSVPLADAGWVEFVEADGRDGLVGLTVHVPGGAAPAKVAGVRITTVPS